jgi:CRISPR-associated protein Cas6
MTMFWDEKPQENELQLPDDVVDVSYRIDCRCLPLDHAHTLSGVVRRALPWLEEEELAGIHLIHGAESGNGWYRPEDPEHDVLHLSRRARFRLRLPRHRLEEAEGLVGRRFDVDGHELAIGEANVLPLLPQPALFARYLVAEEGDDEEKFLEAAAQALRALDIPATKLLCGRSHWLRTPEGDIFTRSLMVADLDPLASVTLQRAGIGPRRLMGCGLFIGHKDIAPVQAKQG